MRCSTGDRRHPRLQCGLAARAAVLVVAAGLAVRAPVPARGGGLDAEVPAPVPTAESFSTFLDSLHATSQTVSRAGVRAEWAAADSVAALVDSLGPAAIADTLGVRRRRAVEFLSGPGLMAMNRVEGARAGARLGFRGERVELTGAAAYAFSAEEWRHREKLRLDAKNGGTFLASYEDLVVPYGVPYGDLTPEVPNSIYTLFAGADDLDYLGRKGWQLESRLGTERRSFRVAYSVYDEWSEPARTDWNLFGRDRGPRPNPAVTDGTGRRLLLAAEASRNVAPLRGALCRLEAEAEIAGYGFGGDFDYDRYRIELGIDFHALARDDARLRLAVGGARNELPVQSRFYLGGPSILRAYGVHELTGDRVLGGGLDYFIGTDPLARLGLDWAQIQFIPFGEIGAAWFDENGRGVFSPPESAAWKSDLGLGFQRNVFAGATARFDFCWRLDRSADRLTTRFAFRAPLFDRFGDGESQPREERQREPGRRGGGTEREDGGD